MRSQSRVCKSIPLDGKTISTPAQSYSFCQAFLHAYTCIRIHIYIHIYVCQTLMLLSVKAFSCPHSYIYIHTKTKTMKIEAIFFYTWKNLTMVRDSDYLLCDIWCVNKITKLNRTVYNGQILKGVSQIDIYLSGWSN